MPLNPRDIPEVTTFLEAEAQLKDFLDNNPEFNEVYKHLVDRRNDALEQADKAVRRTGEACGPFTIFRSTPEYDVSALVEGVGREKFLQMGGVIETATEYKLDKRKLEAAIARGDIPEALLADVKKSAIRYSTPKKIGLL